MPKKHIIIFGVLCVVALGLGYWSGPFKKDSWQRAEVVAPIIITNVLREVVTNIVRVPLPVPELNPIVEKAIREKLKKPTGELTKADYEKVTELDLEDNQLTDVTGLENLTQLESLNLHFNQLTDVKGLVKLTQLTKLGLHDNKLTDVKGLEKLTKLEVLALSGNPDLTKSQIDELQKVLPKCIIGSNPKK